MILIQLNKTYLQFINCHLWLTIANKITFSLLLVTFMFQCNNCYLLFVKLKNKCEYKSPWVGLEELKYQYNILVYFSASAFNCKIVTNFVINFYRLFVCCQQTY
jgi:hypothetical protein